MNIDEVVRSEIARILECPISEVDFSKSLGEIGFDSVNYAALLAFTEKQFGVKIKPETLFEHSSIQETLDHIKGLKDGAETKKVESSLKSIAVDATTYVAKDIAIIGASVRVAGAQNLEDLWSLVASGSSQISPFPQKRNPLNQVSLADTGYLSGGFIQDVDAFDAGFFGISAREALLMDPQQRIAMESAWHAFEDAGYTTERLTGSKTAVFVGASSFDYYELLNAVGLTHATHVGTGLSHSIIANRISQFFNLKGESEAIDAACASSLVAVMRAVSAIRSGKVDLALAGGVNVLASQTTFQIFADAGMLSQDGVCRPFDDAANGYVRGEGAGFVVLKDAKSAKSDGDRILAVIKGGAVQHGGRAQSLTSPNPEEQAAVIVSAYLDAGVDAGSVSYVEAHGTATTLGDPIEAKGLQKAFERLEVPAGKNIPIGSIKSQIGHLEAAAGIAGLLKLVTVLNRRTVPASRYIQKLNRYIDFANQDLSLPTVGETLSGVKPLLGSVSSFGFGGTNAHVVVESAFQEGTAFAEGEPRWFLFSAKTEEALARLIEQYRLYLQDQKFTNIDKEQGFLQDLAYTLMVGRSALSIRRVVSASNISELIAGLTLAGGKDSPYPKSIRTWLSGESVNWRREYPHLRGHLITLPPYPFTKDRFWVSFDGKTNVPKAVIESTPSNFTVARDIESLVMNEVADISSYPLHRVKKEMRLISDLGFDSVMLIGFVSKISEGHESAERILPSLLAADVPISEIIANLEQSGSLKTSQATVFASTAEKEVPTSAYESSIECFPELQDLEARFAMAKKHGVAPTYFSVNDGISTNMTTIEGKRLSNYSSYNYLGLSGDPEVIEETTAAMRKYGTSVSASRILSGEKVLHKELERHIADFLGCEDAIVFVGGHATNVSVIGHLVGPEDIIIYDSLAHDSILRGAIQSGARRRSFPHNDMQALDAILHEVRPTARRILIAAEGVYSMDGDIVPLDQLIAIKKKHGALLFLDEAHSLGVIGATGRGAGEFHNVNRKDVDLWMGSLSKSFASCGGFIAGTAKVIHYLKYTTPGFIFSAGITPPNAASALSAVKKIMREPERVQRLQALSRYFIDQCRAKGIDVGLSSGTAIVPIIIGDSVKCMQLKAKLRTRGVNVDPIVYPAVPEHLARLRFFLTASHTEEQISETVTALYEEMRS